MVYESIVSDCISVTQSNFCPQTGLAEQTEDSFLSGPSDWKAGRQEDNGPIVRTYYEPDAGHVQGFDISNSVSQLPPIKWVSSAPFHR